jgi:hypothetical protein
MNKAALLQEPALLRVLWAYLEAWKGAPQPEAERQICYRWVQTQYENRFGGRFHQTQLKTLEKLGVLTAGWLTGGGRHYLLKEPAEVRNLLAEVMP